YAAFNFSYFTAFNLIPTSLAALIFYTYPILVAILAAFLGQEKIDVRKSLAVAAAFLGIYLVYSDFNIVAVKLGLAVAFLASVFYAFYIIGGNILLNTTNFLNVVFFTCTISAVLFFSLGYNRGVLNFNHSAKVYFYLSLITLIALISLIAILYGIKYTTPTVAAVISMAEPVVTVFLSLLILSESFSALQYVGSVIVFISSLYIVLKNPSL
ncbi:MAG: DMT family transporter, partial [Bacillota bacterium]